MPQIQLPIFPFSSIAITSELAFEQRDGQVYYFNGHLPVFAHPVDDIASFRFFTTQLLLQALAQALLDDGMEVPPIAARLGILPNTLHKAISHNRFKKKIAPH